MHYKSILLGFALTLAHSSQAHAMRPVPTNEFCGEGVIIGVVVGGWNGQGIHLEVDWANDKTPAADSPLFSGSKLIRILESDVGASKFKALEASSLLAFANGYYVRFKTDIDTSAGPNDCTRIKSLDLFKEAPTP